jgi:ubiquinone/menaquinone biosynthesis C-methylase UbiE
MTITYSNNEQLAAAAFSSQARSFDELYSTNKIIEYKRKRVRDHIKKYIHPGDFILELNSGTGQDAVWLAQQGCRVHATDIAGGMLEVLQERIIREGMVTSVSSELCSFTALSTLRQQGPYDMIFSNFAGLNCTDQLDQVLNSFSSLIKRGGIVTLVLLPKFCLWEFLLIIKGKFNTATRRFFSSKGRTAHMEGTYFKCWYYNPSFITERLNENFNVLSIEGLCTIVPPSYLENFGDKYRRVFKLLKSAEDKFKSVWPWKHIGDYYIITLRKR